MKKRVLSLFAALVLCFSMLPTAAFAEGGDAGISDDATSGGVYIPPNASTEGGGGVYDPTEDTRTEIWRDTSSYQSIGRSYDGTTDGSMIKVTFPFTDGSNEILPEEGKECTAVKTFDSPDAGTRTVSVELTLIGEAAEMYKLKAGEETFTIGGNINKAHPELTVSLSKTTCTVGEKLLPLLSVSGVQEEAAVTYYYTQYKAIAGYSEYEGSDAMPEIDENTTIGGTGTYYVYAKTAETKNYEEERSGTVELTVSDVTEPACTHGGADGFAYTADKCPDCGAPAVAQTALLGVEGNPWRNFADLQTVLDAARDGSFTLRLLADVSGDYTIDGTRNTGLDLNGYCIKGTVAVTGTGGEETAFSNSKSTGTIQAVVAYENAKLAVSGAAAVIEKLTLAEGATWDNIVFLPRYPGYKVHNSDGTYKWYAPSEVNVAELNNVSIESLPITTKSLYLKVDSKNVSSVERGTTVQLCASCNTSGADVRIYVGKLEGNAFVYSECETTYQKIGSTWYYVKEYTFTEIGTYDVYFTASKDGYLVSSDHKTLTVTKLNLSKAEITFPNGNESAYEPYNSTTRAPRFTVTYNGKELESGVDYTVSGDSSTYGAGKTCTLTITAVEGSEYTGKKTARWKIVPHKARASVGDVIKVYDGTTDLPDGKISLVSAGSAVTPVGQGLPLAKDRDYMLLNAHYDSANASEDEKTISFTIKLLDKNYIFEDGSTQKDFTLKGSETDKTFKINQGSIDLSKNEFTQLVFNDLAKTYEIDLKPMLEDVLKQQTPAGVEYGSIKYQACNYDFNPSDYLDGTTISVSDDGILSLPIASAHTANAGDEIGTLKVNVNTTNYGLFQLPIKVKVGEKITPVKSDDFKASATDIIYRQTVENSTLTVTGTMKDPRTGKEVKGTFTWPNKDYIPSQTGECYTDWMFTPAAGYEEYATATGTVCVIVNPKSIEGATVTLETDSLEYNKTEQSPKITGVTLADWSETITYSIVSGGSATNACESITLTIEGTGNYTGKATAEWKITSKTVTPTIEVASCSYTGEELKPTVTLKDGDAVIPTDEYTVEYSNNINAGAGLVTIKDVEGGNYIINGSSQDFPISQATAPAATRGSLNVINGTTLTYTYDFSSLLPKLSKGEYGTVSYNYAGINSLVQGYNVIDTPSVNETTGALTLKLESVWSTGQLPPGSVGTVSVRVYTTNFQSFLLEINLNPIDQIKPTPDGAITAAEITYGQTLNESRISGKMKAPDTGEAVEGIFTWKDGTVKPNAGSYDADWTFTPDDSYKGVYATVTGKASVTVNRKSIEGAIVTLEQDSFVYDGEVKTPKVKSVVLDGESLAFDRNNGYGINCNATAEVGTYHDFYVGGNGNYTGRVSVTWSITARTVTPTAQIADGSYVYTGEKIEPTVTLKDDLGNTIDPKEYTVSYSNNINAGTAAVTIKNKDGGNYVLNEASTTFTINKAAAPTNIETGTLNVINGTTLTYTYDAKQLLPAAPKGEYGEVLYAGTPSSNFEPGYTVNSCQVAIEGGVLTLTIDALNGEKVGKIGSIPIYVTTDNYEVFSLPVDLYAVNKTKLLPDNLSCSSLVYGQKLGESTISGTMYAEGDVTKTPISGKFAWELPNKIPTDGFNFVFNFTPDDLDHYEVYTGSLLVHVDPADISKLNAAIGTPTYTYNGEAQKPSVPTITFNTADGTTTLRVNIDYRVTADPETNVGTYKTMTITGMGLYTGTISGLPWMIKQRTADPIVTVENGTYNGGKEIRPTVTVKDDLGNTIDSSEYTVEYENNVNAGTGKVTIKNAADGNYVLSTLSKDFKINKANGGSLGSFEDSQKYTYTDEFTFTPDWSELPSGQKWSYSSEYSVSTGSNVTLTKQDFAADGSLLTYAISGGRAGEAVTITLKASCDNYEDFTITLNITLTERDNQKALVITGTDSVVYGQTLTLTTTGGSGTGAVTYAVKNETGEATIDPNTGVLTPVKVGSVCVTAVKAGDKEYSEAASAPFVITITKATPSGAPKYTRITTRGKTLADANLTLTGSTLNPSVGTLEWVDSDGKVLPGDTRVEANKRYTWRFTPADGNYTILTGEVELYHVSYGGGSAGSTKVDDKPEAGVFEDVTPGSYYEDAVEWAVKNGITTGTDAAHFSPDGICTRAQAVTFLWRAAGSPAPASRTMPFADVPVGSYYYDAVLWAVESGITRGTSDTAFSPEATCSRAQIVAFLWRAAKSPAAGSGNLFTDVAADAYYFDAVLWAVKADITKGTTNTTFSPDANCTRAQIVTFLWRCRK